MTQKFHFKTFPSGKLEDAPFTTTTHGRQLVEEGGKLKMKLGAGKEKRARSTTPGRPCSATRRPTRRRSRRRAAEAQERARGSRTRSRCKRRRRAGQRRTPKYSISSGDKLGCSVDSIGRGQDRRQARHDHGPGGRREALRRGHDHHHRAGRPSRCGCAGRREEPRHGRDWAPTTSPLKTVALRTPTMGDHRDDES